MAVRTRANKTSHSSPASSQKEVIKLNSDVFLDAISNNYYEDYTNFLNPDESTVTSTIGLSDWLNDVQIVEALRQVVSEDKKIAKSVKIFPEYCPVEVRATLRREIYDRLDQQHQPERASPKGKRAKAAYDKKRSEEEEARNEELEGVCEASLIESGIDNERKDFDLYLSACRGRKELWENSASPENIRTGDQWAIPVRLDEGHHVMVLVNFRANGYEIKYFNTASEQSKQIAAEIEPIILGLKDHLENVNKYYANPKIYKDGVYRDYSLPIQGKKRDGHNCGPLTYYNFLYFIYQNAGIKRADGKYQNHVNEKEFKSQYFSTMKSLREEMVENLTKRGAKVVFEIEPEEEEEILDSDDEFLSWTSIILMFTGMIAVTYLTMVGIPPQLTAWGTELFATAAANLPANPILTLGGAILAFVTTKMMFGYVFSSSPEVETPVQEEGSDKKKKPQAEIDLTQTPKKTVTPRFDATKCGKKASEQEENNEASATPSPKRKGKR